MQVSLNPSPSSVVSGQPVITPEEADKRLTAIVSEMVTPHLKALIAAKQKEKEADKRLQESDKRLQEAEQVSLAADKRIKEIDEEKENLKKVKESIGAEKRKLITEVFYSIFFSKKPCPIAEIETLFTTYLAKNDVISLEKNELGKACFKLKSMTGIIQYVKDHPAIKNLDFRALKGDVGDIPTLVDYLKTSNIKAIAFKTSILEEYKLYLTSLVNANKEPIKVQYFA